MIISDILDWNLAWIDAIFDDVVIKWFIKINEPESIFTIKTYNACVDFLEKLKDVEIYLSFWPQVVT